MREEHFNFLPFSGRAYKRLASPQRLYVLAFFLGHGSIISNQPVALQRFAAWTSKGVGLVVELKVGSCKKAPGLPFSIQERHMRLDPPAHQPWNETNGR
jgi:hypothetical protein